MGRVSKYVKHVMNNPEALESDETDEVGEVTYPEDEFNDEEFDEDDWNEAAWAEYTEQE